VNPNSFFGEGGNARDRKWMSDSASRRNRGREAKRVFQNALAWNYDTVACQPCAATPGTSVSP
jgi:hypothetical protein